MIMLTLKCVEAAIYAYLIRKYNIKFVYSFIHWNGYLKYIVMYAGGIIVLGVSYGYTKNLILTEILLLSEFFLFWKLNLFPKGIATMFAAVFLKRKEV